MKIVREGVEYSFDMHPWSPSNEITCQLCGAVVTQFSAETHVGWHKAFSNLFMPGHLREIETIIEGKPHD